MVLDPLPAPRSALDPDRRDLRSRAAMLGARAIIGRQALPIAPFIVQFEVRSRRIVRR